MQWRRNPYCFYRVSVSMIIPLLVCAYFFSVEWLHCEEEFKGSKRQYKVLWVIDGDTIKIDTQDLVRYIGIDTPEARKKKNGKWVYNPEPFAEEAKKINMQLVKGKTVQLEFDVEKRDKYGRLLAYVFVDDEFVNEQMLRKGYANLLTIPPNIKYVEIFREALKDARKSQRGMWENQTY